MKPKCACKPVLDMNKRVIATSKSNCFVHSPETARHNARLDRLLKKRRREK